MAFAFIPPILGCIFKIARGQNLYFPLLSFFSAALILSHNVVAILFVPTFLIIGLITVKKEKLKFIGSLILGGAIAAFFWIPAIFDLQFVRLSQIKVSQVSDHLVPFSKLIIPSWGYGPNPNGANPMPVQIGIVSIFIFLSCLLLRLVKKDKDWLFDILLFTFALIVFLMSSASLPIWQNFPALGVIQFPWRMLSVLVFASAFLTAYVIDASSRKILLSAIVIAAAILAYLGKS